MSAIKNDQILIYCHFNKVMKGTGTSFQSPALCQKHGKGNVGMIAWVVVFHWLRVCDYFFFYSVCYQQTAFIVSLCGCVCLIGLFITVFVLCNGTKTMLIVINGFTCNLNGYF